jgi:putative transcriptional regulator
MITTLKVERARLNMTQQELAERVQVSRQTINSIEAGRYVPSAVLAIKISQVFNATVNDLFRLEEGD